MALANKLGSFSQLAALVGNTIHDLIRISGSFLSDPITGLFDPPARTEPTDSRSPILFADDTFSLGRDDDIRGLAVHEVFHLIDYNMADSNGFLWMRYSFPRTAKLSGYAMDNRAGLEYWAEAGADWVYGQRYQYTRTKDEYESLAVDQRIWINRVLKGWGWGP